MEKCCQKGSTANNNIISLKKDLEVLADENRLRILCLLKEHKSLCVCDIYDALGLPQNLASYHLGKLKEAGFVASKKQGAKVLYSQNRRRVEAFQKTINNQIIK